MDVAQTVARAISILEVLSKHKKLSAGKIITLLGFHKSTAYRLLGTLQQLKYVRKDEESGLYSLTPRILRLSSAVLETQDITVLARPHLKALHEATQETIHLALLEDQDLIYLDKMESTKNLRVVMSSQKGSHAPLYCTGLGKVLLAWMDEDELNEYLGRIQFTAYTPHTITAVGTLKNELADIRKQGYALDREEHEVGVFCVAAPVRDAFDQVAAALSVSIPVARLSEKIKKEIQLVLCETADKISRVLAR